MCRRAGSKSGEDEKSGRSRELVDPNKWSVLFVNWTLLGQEFGGAHRPRASAAYTTGGSGRSLSISPSSVADIDDAKVGIESGGKLAGDTSYCMTRATRTSLVTRQLRDACLSFSFATTSVAPFALCSIKHCTECV